MIIDVHTHIVPEHFPPMRSRRVGNGWPFMQHVEGDRANVMIEGANFRTVLSSCWSTARRITEMPAQGVDKQVLSPMPRLLDYEINAEDGLDLARCLNETIARMADAAPDRFYGLGAVPLQDVELATLELARGKELGLLGIEVQTNIAGKNLADPEFCPFLMDVERLGLAILSHAQNPTFPERLIGEAAAGAVGFPVENGLAAAAVVMGGVLVDCPNLRICYSHGGGVFTQLLPRLENQWQSGGALWQALPLSPIAYARMMYYDDVFVDNRTLRYLIEMVGISQVMVGLDYPFSDWRASVNPEQEFNELGLSAAEREAVGYRNCLRFLGLAE